MRTAGCTPASLVFLRTALGAVLLLPLVIRHGNARALLARWRMIALFTVVEMGIPWLLLSHAEQRVATSGTLAMNSPASELAHGRPRAAVAVVGCATGPMIIARRLANLPAPDVVAASLTLCAATYAPVGLAQLPAALPSAQVIGAMAVLGVACTAAAFLLFFALIAEVGPVPATVITYVNPAVAVAAGVGLLGEPLTLGTGIGFAGAGVQGRVSPRPLRAAPRPRRGGTLSAGEVATFGARFRTAHGCAFHRPARLQTAVSASLSSRRA